MLPQATLLQERYRVVDHIGRGGMGSVYLADDLRLHTTVAIKQMLVAGDRLSDAFNREAQLLAALRHPTIPRVIDHFVDQNGQFLVMEYIPGDDIGTMLSQRQQPFGLTDVLLWADQLLGALDYLHNHTPPVIHRDIKPQNLKLTAKNEIVLLDFGLAKTSFAGAGGSDSIFGYTPHYAPIEQIQGLGTDARTDLYSLAATFYHLLTGKMPVDAVSRASAVVNDQLDPLTPPDELDPAVPPAVAEVLMQALAQKASERPHSAAEMRESLRIAVHDSASLDLPLRRNARLLTRQGNLQEPTRARSTIRLPAPGQEAQRQAGRRPIWQLVLGVGAVVTLAGASVLGWNAARGPAAAPTSVPAVVVPATAELMKGSLNIAVADFTPSEQAGCAVQADEASGLAMVVYQALLDQMQTAKGGSTPSGAGTVSLGDFELRSPEQTGSLVSGDSRAAAAKAKAEELNADVVLYGDVACQEAPRQTLLRPQIYISDRKLQSFDQLLFIGEHAFGPELVSSGLPTSGPTRQSIAAGLVPRMTVLTQFLVGLDYYYAGTYDQAYTAFSAANAVPAFDDKFITSMVTLYQGTTASRRREFDEAREHYQKVLELDPSNQTALYSLADASFWRARGNCSPAKQSDAEQPTDTEGLRESLSLYQQVDAPGDSALDKTVRGMTAFGLGQLYSCMTQAQIADETGRMNYWPDAEQFFKQAITLLDQEGAYAKDFLAESHAGLAVVYLSSLSSRDRATVDAVWRRAGEEYCSASKLSGYAYRQASFLHRLAAIHGYLGELDQAEIERQKAISLDPASAEQQDGGLHKQWLADRQSGVVSKEPVWKCE